ncbi:SDR family NAD(P)-dependent oxidoreductase [Plantactinospora sp. S1510]|uniref:SDR family NAD(P)-dependent oxidoreductase n=1 Tax=Plantactinospora alkalitolerans TaxID=2789879 RepID=A0ABS0H3X5_9ACTN|nr:type I polyketide synthase [Plantactinospora alkalitolerans]MBF9132822.1 SDR family NAD(P)-dependent oxidoreductase [Plantactinospora alkalitolerans]
MLGNEQSFHKYTELLRAYLPFSGPTPLQLSDDLAELGLDSLNTVALLVEIEDALGVTIPDEALTVETFSTVGSLWSTVSALAEDAARTDQDAAGPPQPAAPRSSVDGANAFDHGGPLTVTPPTMEAETSVGAETSAGAETSVPTRATVRPVTPVEPDRRIAVIGMAGRFPGASDVTEFWRNISGGIQSLTTFTEEELLTAGVDPALVKDPQYVAARPVLKDIRGFDAEFFGYNPREAKIADPQQRVFLECAWETLEVAGYAVPDRRGRVGVFGGTNLSTYSLDRFALHPSMMEITPFELIIGNDKDALATMVSYKLNLTGPSIAVQTFCSTSLSAVHLAIQSLRRGECDMALAGGVCIRVPDRIGYLYQEGGQESPDAHVRTFDKNSQGGVFGDGAAVVLLKPLNRAIEDRDTILGVIRGSAMNNDGAQKFSYTAPSVVGQARAVADALVDAEVSPQDISYVEAHGTATELGDPIEVAALTRAYGPDAGRQYCAIGSVKTNVGHLDRAAGATGLIKILESMRHEELPATLHYTGPNPEIDFANSPFFVSAENRPWPRVADRPRLAGLNSLGVGGTNVHAVIEEPPLPVSRPTTSRRWQVLPVSARSEKAVRESCTRLAQHLREHTELPIADVAFTLQVGRDLFDHRRVAVAGSTAAAAGTLDGTASTNRLLSRADSTQGRGVGFLLAGVGEHHPGMVADLYAHEPVFRAHVDDCQRLLAQHSAIDVVAALTGSGAASSDVPDLAQLMGRVADAPTTGWMDRTEIAQPAVFVAEYALARTLMDWGVTPSVLVGYSVGEYVAACLAGVLSLPDALRLVAHRAQLIAALPAGAMLAVASSADDLHDRVPDLRERGLDIAALNGAQIVIAGPVDAVTEVAGLLRGTGVACRNLQTTHAFHSRMLAPAAAALTDWVAQHITLNPPTIPYVSNLNGQLVDADLVTDPGYWARHMCGTVRFADSLSTALDLPDIAFLEIGPGKSLGAMLRTHPNCGIERWPLIVSTLPAAAESLAADATLADALGRLWLAGVLVDWDTYHNGAAPGGWKPGRLHLPTYPFQRQNYWYDENRPAGQTGIAAPPATGGTDLDSLPRLPEERWLHVPVWRQTAPRPAVPATATHWLVYTDVGMADALVGPLADALAAGGDRLTFVRPGEGFEDGVDGFRIRPGSADDTLALFAALHDGAGLPDRVLHLWTLPDEAGPRPPTEDRGEIAAIIQRGLHTLVALARTAQESGLSRWSLDVVSSGTQRIDDELLHPARATVVGPCRMIPVEYPLATARLIDLPQDAVTPIMDLIGELRAAPSDRIVALRRGRRWVPTYDVLQAAEDTDVASAGVAADRVAGTAIRHGGTYLVTGGLGGIGLALAERLADQHGARLVLFGRTPVPPPAQWDDVLADPQANAEVRRRIEGLRRLEASGAQFALVAGDVADPADVRRAVDVAIERFGALHGVLQAAGVPGVGLMQFKTNADMDRVLAPKVAGTVALARALDGIAVDFVVLFSSVASATGALGQTDYCAANVFLDAFAQSGALPQTRVVSIGWGEWLWNGWTSGLGGYEPAVREFLQRHRAHFGINFDEGWRAMLRVLDSTIPHVVVSTQDFAALVERSADYSLSQMQDAAQQVRGVDRHPRPDLSTQYAAPRTPAEQTVADVWAESLGLEKVGIHDNFFELGGTSLIGVGIVDAVRRALKLPQLPAHILYQSPTVAALAVSAVSGTAGSGTEADESDSKAAERAKQQRSRVQKRRESLRGGRPA